MGIKYNLIKCKENYLRIKDNVERIEIITKNGERHGIGNKEALKVIFDAMIDEIDRQINE